VPTEDDPPPANDGRTLEATIAFAFVVAIIAACGFAALYVSGNETQLAGLCVFVALGSLALGLGLWARYFMPSGPDVEKRHQLRSSDEERESFGKEFDQGERTFTRRRLLTRLLGAGVLAGALAALFPFKSLGPNPGDALAHTNWTKGRRLVDTDGKPLRPGDLLSGSAVTVFPEGVDPKNDPATAASQTVLINYGEAHLNPRPGREHWTVDNCVAYSKVCTHAGCPVGLYEAKSHQLMCPCHQSLFDVLDGARPVFGPAPRSLPQLPLALDDEGYLVAQRDYSTPVGPGYWHRP
jgi:ubiquinol-cytochrome c reductase iron-sulfur subunit